MFDLSKASVFKYITFQFLNNNRQLIIDDYKFISTININEGVQVQNFL